MTVLTQHQMKSADAGFTLLELMVSTAIMVVLSSFMAVAVFATSEVSTSSAVESSVQDDVRELLTSMTKELILASAEGNDAIDPEVLAVAIVPDPAENSPIEIQYQVPIDEWGQVWSEVRRFRFITEDLNNNAKLDDGEDSNGDGILNRSIVQLADRNGDGDTTDPEDISVVAGSQYISNLQFALNGRMLTIVVGSSRPVPKHEEVFFNSNVTTAVCIMN